MVDPILDDTNPEQRAAITHGEGPLLVVAGAGSGKTRVITRRVAHLVRTGVAPRQIVALTFTNKAAREMRARIDALVPAADLWVCTFHSFCARVLRRFAERVGRTPEFSIYDTDDRDGLLKEILKERGFDELRPAQVAQAITRAKNGLGAADASGLRGPRVAEAARVYEERLAAANALDFDDLLVYAGRVLEGDTEVCARVRERARFLLVDEYQDTNEPQYRVLRALALPERNVCATGDPDQSIYRWRGATIRNILDFERDFPGARVVTLDRNYRSTKAVLAVANAVIRHNVGRLHKELRTSNPDGVPVQEVRCLHEGDEALAVVAATRRWIAAGRCTQDVAVFYRVNAQSRAIERAFAQSGVPYRIVGAVEFFKRREVKDVLAYVRLARNPRDAAAFLRVANVPPRGIGERSLARVLDAAGARGVAPREALRDPEALAASGRARRTLEELGALLDRIEALPAADPAEFLKRVVEETRYDAFVAEETDRAENVRELVNAAAEYALREPEGGIDGFLEENALASDQDAYDAAADAVTLMTVHSAKGLEFPCVAVTGLEEEVFPHALSVRDPDAVEEERRLFYVAVTRAREELALFWAGHRMRFGLETQSRPSRFLDEIPEGLLRVEDRAGDTPLLGETEPVYRLDDGVADGFEPGERVRHDHFGAGRVLAVQRRGGATRIVVDFDAAGRRELALEYARLTRI